MSKRRYTDNDRSAALAALAANAGNLSRTARQMDIPRSTLSQWAGGSRHPEALAMSSGIKEDLAQLLEDLARALLSVTRQSMSGLSADRAMVCAAIALDKMLLLRGKPTAINEERGDDRLRIFRERYAQAQADGDNGTGPGPSARLK
jgi:hypothetical protein